MFSFNAIKDEVFKFLGIDSLIRAFDDYIKARVELIKKEIRDELAVQISKIMVMILVMIIGLLTLSFLSIAVGFWLSQVLGSPIYGFLSLGGVYLFFCLIIWVSRHNLSDSIAENIKRKFEKKSQENGNSGDD